MVLESFRTRNLHQSQDWLNIENIVFGIGQGDGLEFITASDFKGTSNEGISTSHDKFTKV